MSTEYDIIYFNSCPPFKLTKSITVLMMVMCNVLGIKITKINYN